MCSFSSRSGSIRTRTTRRRYAAANREATRAAIADALEPPAPEAVRALAQQRDEATNAYYTGD